MRKKERIVIFGGNGFIGGNLVKQLNAANKYKIRIFDRFTEKESPIINECVQNGGCEIFKGDFLNKVDVKNALDGYDYVFHLISMSTPASLYDNLQEDIKLNVNSTISLLELCVDAKIKNFIFISSGGAIYGDQKNIDKFKESMVVEPISPYAISKVTIEKILNYYKKRNNLDFLVLRYSNPFGPGHSVKSSVGLIPILLRKAINNEVIEVYGDGEIIRDYIYVDDAVQKTIKLFEKNSKYTLYNIASGKGRTINDIIKSIKENTNLSLNVKYISSRSADVERVVLDVSRIEKEINIQDIDFDLAMQKTYKWISKNLKY